MKVILFIISLFLTTILYASDIHEATMNGDLERVKALLKTNNQLINEKDAEGDIPLCTAIVSRHTELSLFFIEKGADINNQNQDGFTPLHWAAMLADTIIVKKLIEKGANLDLVTRSNETALHYAAERGYVDIVKLLVENGAALEIVIDTYHRTPLLMAARERGGIETIRVLVEGGSNINAADYSGDTPLSLSAWRGFEEIVDYLLEKKAKFNVLGEEGIKLLSYAADKRLWNLYYALIQKGGEEFLSELKKKPVLHWAASGGSQKIVADLIKRDLQINALDAYYWCPLHYAAYCGRLEAAKLLIEKGADINAKTPLGETPLYLAQMENKKEVIDLLVSTGADQTPPEATKLTSKYLGQKKVGKQLELFAPGVVSRLKGGHSNITFSPDGKEAFWTEWILVDKGYSPGCTVWYSKIKDGVWTLPNKFLSDGDTPFFSADGQKIFLLSSFPLPPENNDVRGIWYYKKKKDSFSGPNYLNFDVNGTGLYWQFSLDKNENLYFTTDEGLFRSLNKDGEYQEKENLAYIFHPDYKGGAPYISPDGDYIIFNSMVLPDSFGSLDLYIGFRNAEGVWSKPINMGPTVNSAAQEHLALVSPDGKYLFLRTERNGVNGIYWMDANIIDELKRKDLR